MTVRRSADAERLDARSPKLGLAVDATPMRSHSPLRKLPPLNSLRTFEVVARHGSFTNAAAELLVTPAAGGQQVRLLEDFMGVALFRRESRALVLTPAGAASLPCIRAGFAQRVAAARRARPR